MIIIIAISCKIKKKQEFVIGNEMAEADKNEQQRLNSNDLVESPLGNQKYSDFEGGTTFQNPTEVELDKKIIQITKEYQSSSEEERVKIRKSISKNDIYTILSFCKRVTVFGLRGQNENITFGLAALSMVEVERCDYRDALVSIAFLNHGIERIKLNADELYEEAINLANPRMKELLSSFKELDPKSKKIETMAGFTEYQFESGIGFIPCGYEKYNPQRDLPSIAFTIGKEIEKDKYQAADISIAQELPIVWIKGKSEDDVKRVLNQSLGTVSLQAYIREEFTKDWVSQMFLFYLVEFENENKATEFKKLLGEEGTDKFARMFGSVENIFYILISRSTTVGVEDYETNESLQRLRELIERKIREEKSH